MITLTNAPVSLVNGVPCEAAGSREGTMAYFILKEHSVLM